MKPALIFFEGQPYTVKELAARFEIPRYVLTQRARRCKNRKMYQGESCAVFTKDNLKRPQVRRTVDTKQFLLKLSEREIEVFCNIANKVEDLTEEEQALIDYLSKVIKPKFDGLKMWNALVRGRHD